MIRKGKFPRVTICPRCGKLIHQRIATVVHQLHLRRDDNRDSPRCFLVMTDNNVFRRKYEFNFSFCAFYVLFIDLDMGCAWGVL